MVLLTALGGGIKPPLILSDKEPNALSKISGLCQKLTRRELILPPVRLLYG